MDLLDFTISPWHLKFYPAPEAYVSRLGYAAENLLPQRKIVYRLYREEGLKRKQISEQLNI